MLKKIFRLRKDEVVMGWRKLLKKNFINYTLPNYN
jgi:hypothetical protein